MCGIAGELRLGGPLSGEQYLRDMGNAIRHRGPDDSGVWRDVDSGIGLAHQRLSIVELSKAGHQPMVSPSTRFVIVFNGEIYNHLELRQELEASLQAPAWRGHSDTETLLAAVESWGVERTLIKCIGMFAMALWDKQEKTLTLARDRIGEKPLYYGWQGSGNSAVFLFGSELKALKANPDFRADIDRNALAVYLRHNYVPAPHSIYQGIHKLMPGTYLSVSARRTEPAVTAYWSASKVMEDSVPFRQQPADDEKAVAELDTLLKSAVAQQMVADVPLGAFLSGGIDSSTIVALMQCQSSTPIKTFTIGFNESGYNEAQHAKAVAQHLGTEHTELYVSATEAMNVVPSLPGMYDEPFSDSSQIPTHLVAALARQHVTVSLSGDAGDELFSGYTRYTVANKFWQKLSVFPVSVRKAFAQIATSLSPSGWDTVAKCLPIGQRKHRFGDKVHKAASVLASPTIDSLYLKLLSHWDDPGAVVIGGTESQTLITGLQPSLTGLDAIERMMAIDLLTYLPDDILVKVDRAAMAVSLETRVPMLDHRVVEFAWRLPQHLKQRQGVGKWVLRQVLYKYVPQALIDRPKMGFGVPIDTWLRGPLRDWAESLLSEARLRDDGYFHAPLIRQKWKEHLSGTRNWAYHLWDILMFQAWLDEQKK